MILTSVYSVARDTPNISSQMSSAANILAQKLLPSALFAVAGMFSMQSEGWR